MAATSNNFGFVEDAQPAANNFGFVADEQAQSPLQTNPAFVPRVGADVLAGLAQMGHGLINAPHNIANVVSPTLAAKIPTQQDYNYGQMLGVNSPNLGDKLIQGAAQYAPYMLGGEAAIAAKGAESLPLLSRALIQSGAGATFGATQSQNPVSGALLGAGLGAAGEAAPALVGATKNAINAVRPQSFAQQLMDNLSGGNTLEGNAQSLAQDIKSAYNNRVNQGKSLYQPIFDNAGNNSIYQGVNQAVVRKPADNFKNINDIIDHVNDTAGTDLESPGDLKDYLMQQHGYAFPDNKSIVNFFNSYPATVNKGAYNTLDSSIVDSYDRGLNQLHENFTDNPTLQNAHNLQSQLGYSIRNLQAKDAKSGLTPVERSALQGYQEAQGAIRGDINDFLNAKNPALAQQYNLATENWQQNVTPYLDNPKISQIAKGNITNPSAITNIFKNPEPEVQQIVNDIGPQANNKILFSELGKTKANLTPERLTNAFNQLDKNGLSSYITPEIDQQFGQLAGKTAARNTAQVALGALLGGHFAGPLGSAVGAVATPLISKLAQSSPSFRIPLSNALLSAARAGYRPAVNTTNANIVNALENQK